MPEIPSKISDEQGQNACEHVYSTYLRGGVPLSVRICMRCKRPDWADIRQEIEKIRESAYQAGREDEARDALTIRGELDITTVVASLDRLESEGGDLGRAAGDLLRRLPTWMGSDGHYRPAGPHQLNQLRQEECRADREDAARDILALPDAQLPRSHIDRVWIALVARGGD